MISTDEIGQISLGMNSFLTKLKSVMETIRQEARNLRGHSEKLASETSGFHSLIQDQSAAYEEMSASVEELASSASSVTSQAEKQEEQCRAAGKAVGELSGAIGSVHVESATARSEAERMASEVGAGRESIQRRVCPNDERQCAFCAAPAMTSASRILATLR
mgnify:CR=1 FL=1